MARVTVEDCLEEIEDGNRFALVRLAAKRARQLHQGAKPTVSRSRHSRDTAAVTALREIAAGHVNFTGSLPDLLRGTTV